MRIIFLLVTLICLVSCNEKKQPTEYKEPVDVTLRDADGVPMGFHKGYDGVTYYDNDISAPRKGETKEEYERRTESYRSSDNNQYDEGYETGYEEGYEEGRNSR